MKQYCVISHTHWDREWYETKEQFRLRLVELIDHLLDLLECEQEYVFHMDAQTIVIEDYLEIRPENQERIRKFVQEGRLRIGPWYVQNDFLLSSGEATVRNIMLGTKQASMLGRCDTVGYTPDQFGLISQLPQILHGFGMDNCVFGRGFNTCYIDENGTVQEKKNPAEFIWESPDGSEVLAICMSYWYNNAQRFSADIDYALRMTELQKELFEGRAATPYLLLMNGVDHLEAQENLLPILKKVQERLPKDEKIYQTTLEHYVELVRQTLVGKPYVRIGELKEGRNDNLLKDTGSSRIYLKIENASLQNLLEQQLEPLYATLELLGMKNVYPAGELDYLWKSLIQNHAHDSICGCSKDAVHKHMEDRFASIREMGECLLVRGMRQLADHVRTMVDEEDYQIVAFNSCEQTRSETVEVEVDVVASDQPTGLRITDFQGREVPFVVLEHRRINKHVISPINLPGFLETERYRIRMLAEDVPAYGYQAYRVETHFEADEVKGQQVPVASEYCLENSDLKLVVSPDGRIDLFHKESGHWYRDVLTVEDTADIGESYVSLEAPGDAPVRLCDFTPKITVEESDPFLGRLRLHYEYVLPVCYDFVNQKRSDEMVTMPLDILVSLGKEDTVLSVTFDFENRAKDHRMRALIRSGLDSDETFASSPYDIVLHHKWKNDKRICNETEHNSGMVTICENDIGMSVLNRGIYNYENLQEKIGTLAFTIVRATGRIWAQGEGAPEDDTWLAPDNQCLRRIRCELGLLAQCGSEMASKAALAAKAFQSPLLVQCEPVDTHKFLGGRTAVQDSSIAEFFYRDDPYPNCRLGRTGQTFSVEGEGLCVTAFKKAYARDGYILRFFNTKDTPVEAVLTFENLPVGKIYRSNLAEKLREELAVRNGRTVIPVGKKEIITIFIPESI